MPVLTIEDVCTEARAYSEIITKELHPSLLGVTDGKAVGTYVEQNFINYLHEKGWTFERGNAASGLDFPGLEVDIKVTSVKQPQSSCPFRSLRQKIFGLGYGILVFVYDKKDDATAGGARLHIKDTVYISKERTADYTMTSGLAEMLDKDANDEELASFMQSRALTDDHEELMHLAQLVLATRPTVGYLTISPAMQWRLQYKRAIKRAGEVEGLLSLYRI